jgi:hypothetical protein
VSRKEFAYSTRVDYVSMLIEECGMSRDEAEKEVATALARPNNGIRRRGYYRDEYRAGEMEHGEPDPGPGPSERHLPFRLRWLQNNLYSVVEYATEDLDRLLLQRHPSPKRRLIKSKPDQEALNRALRDFATERGRRLKQSDTEALSLLKGMGATTRQIPPAFRELPLELRFGVGQRK